MLAFAKPVLTSYGKSEKVIKGDCGWGGENVVLNKTGAYKTQRRRWIRAACNPNANPGKIICDYCLWREYCSTQSSNCP